MTPRPSMPPEVRVLAHLVRVIPPELWERGPLPGEDLEETAARRDAALDIVAEELAALAALTPTTPTTATPTPEEIAA